MAEWGSEWVAGPALGFSQALSTAPEGVRSLHNKALTIPFDLAWKRPGAKGDKPAKRRRRKWPSHGWVEISGETTERVSVAAAECGYHESGMRGEAARSVQP